MSVSLLLLVVIGSPVPIFLCLVRSVSLSWCVVKEYKRRVKLSVVLKLQLEVGNIGSLEEGSTLHKCSAHSLPPPSFIFQTSAE